MSRPIKTNYQEGKSTETSHEDEVSIDYIPVQVQFPELRIERTSGSLTQNTDISVTKETPSYILYDRSIREFDRLLNLAEKTKERIKYYDFIKRCLFVVSTFSISGLASYLASIFISRLPFDPSIMKPEYVIWIVILASIMGFISYGHLLISQMRREETRYLSTILAGLRETEKALADQYNWSTLQRTEFKYRLQKLGI